MAVQRRGQQPDNPLQWLEEELRETKSRLHKVEQELDQTLKRVWSLDADQHKFAETLSASGATLAALPALKEELRQARDQLSRVQDRQATLAKRAEELFRDSQAEAGRERQEVATLTKQVEVLARGIAQYESRIQALEGASRHVEEEVAGVRLAHQGLARDMEELSGRGGRTLEATIRLEHQLSRASGQIEALSQQDEALADRLNLIQEQIRRQGERLDKLEAAAGFPQEIRELLQRANLEQEKLAERLGAVERVSGDLAVRIPEFVQGLALLDQRSQAQATQLLAMAEQLRELSEQTKTQMKRQLQAMLRQRRRQAEALAQEIKELSQGELNSGE